MVTDQPLLRTPLFDVIQNAHARMVPFSGWEMPVQFTSIIQEHQGVRTQSGLFDISHMGKFVLEGEGLIRSLQTLVPTDLDMLTPGSAQYTVLLNEAGGIVDDLIFYRQDDPRNGTEKGVMIVNAATQSKVHRLLLKHLDLEAIQVNDITTEQVLIAVQGPQAVSHLQSVIEKDLDTIPRNGHGQGMVLGQMAFLARTGYTGEDGFEVMLEPEAGQALWRSLINSGVIPCGLGARDTLRLEAAMALYGQDIDETTSPLEAGLGWLVHLEQKGNFIGRPTLERQRQEGLSRKLVGLMMEGRHIARHGYPLFSSSMDHQTVGTITSGAWSPTLERAIALAYVPSALAKIGTSLSVEVRGRPCPCTVVKRPFYRRSPQSATP